MSDEVKTEVKVKSENERQFDKKKINRMNIDECKKELARLEKVNDNSSKYFKDVTARLVVAPR